MKKHLTILTILCAGTASLAVAESPIYSTGFESDEGFQLGPLDPAAPNWATDGPYAFAVTDGANHGRDNQILESTAGTSDEASRAWLREVDFLGADKVVVELEIMALPSGGNGYQANFQLGEFTGKPRTTMQGTAAQISLRGSGRIVAFDGDVEKEVGPYTPGEWIKLRIEADHSAKKYSVTVNDDVAVADLGFRDPSVFRSQGLGFTHYSGKEGTQPFAMAVDNLKITTP
jgi:hypothetical protein